MDPKPTLFASVDLAAEAAADARAEADVAAGRLISHEALGDLVGQRQTFAEAGCRMKPTVIAADKVADQAGATEPGYATWERAKIERGLAQCRDRAAIIPVEQVWRDLTLDG